MRKIVSRISKTFLSTYPNHNSYFPQSYCNRIPMPVVKYPRGVPGENETCAVLITKEDRWFYNRVHAAEEADIDLGALLEPEDKYGSRTVIRIYKLDPPAEKPARFELTTFASNGKTTRMKSVAHDNPPPDCEELAGGINSSNGTHWTRIAVLLRTIPELTDEQEKEIDEKLYANYCDDENEEAPC